MQNKYLSYVNPIRKRSGKMKLRKCLAILLVVTLAGTLLAGCGGSKSKNESEQNSTESSSKSTGTGKTEFTASGDKIRFAMHPGNGAVAAYRAQKEGYFSDLGLDIEIVMFQNGVLINEGFAAGEVEIGINGFASAYSFATGEYAYLGDVNAQTEYGVYASADSDAAKVQGEVDGLPDVYGTKETVKGMQILAPQGTIAQIVTDAYMAKLGVSSSDYELVGMDAGAALTALLAGEGDAAGLFPPYSTQALNAGYVRLASYEEVCGCVPADVFMATNDFLETHYDDAVLICKSIYKAAEELEADDDLYYNDAMEFFSENGKEYSDSDMRALIASSYFYDEAHLTDQEYEFGYHETYATQNLIALGLLTDDALEKVKESTNKQVLKDAIGIDIKTGFYE